MVLHEMRELPGYRKGWGMIMTQAEVYDLLKKRKRWMSNKEIMEELGVSYHVASAATRNMMNHGDISMKTKWKKSEIKGRHKSMWFRIKKGG